MSLFLFFLVGTEADFMQKFCRPEPLISALCVFFHLSAQYQHSSYLQSVAKGIQIPLRVDP